jgi:hypothetical protein
MKVTERSTVEEHMISRIEMAFVDNVREKIERVINE